MRLGWGAALVVCGATPALADDVALLGYMGGQGCTFGVQSTAGAVAAGFDAVEIDLFITGALERGEASQQGVWIVLDESICTIRLPDIQSRWSVTDPEIIAMTPFYRDEYEMSGEIIIDEGCFFEDAITQFNGLNSGDIEAGFKDYVALIATGIIAGDIRFYSDSPLRTPITFQRMTGACSNVANIDDIARSQPVISDGFDAWVRAAGAYNVCDVDSFSWPPMIDIRLQGYDPDVELEDQDAVNTLMGFEWMFITMAAGWHDGQSATQRGVPRPPLCHYPAQ